MRRLLLALALSLSCDPAFASCTEFLLNGGQLPTVLAGTNNGVKLMWTGTAGGAGASFAVHIIAVPTPDV